MRVYESIVFSLHTIFSLNTRILRIQIQILLGGDSDTAYRGPSTVSGHWNGCYISNIDGSPATCDIKIIPSISPRSTKMHGDHRAAAHRAAVALYGVILLIYKSSTLRTSLNYIYGATLLIYRSPTLLTHNHNYCVQLACQIPTTASQTKRTFCSGRVAILFILLVLLLNRKHILRIT